MKRKLEVKRVKSGFQFEAKHENGVPCAGGYSPDEKLLGSFLDLAEIQVTDEVLKELQDMATGQILVVDAECVE